MSFWSHLFSSRKIAEAPSKSLEYKGYIITAAPFKAPGGWQLAGQVSKDDKVHKFVRADQFSDRDEACTVALSKGQLIVDQLGEAMFKP